MLYMLYLYTFSIILHSGHLCVGPAYGGSAPPLAQLRHLKSNATLVSPVMNFFSHMLHGAGIFTYILELFWG